MSEVTQILKQLEAGDAEAPARLMPLVYEELRKLAAARLALERSDHTLQPTALVHEAYLRLVGSNQAWHGKAHFFAAAASSMRQILVNWARSKNAQKRKAGGCRISEDDLQAPSMLDPDLILDLDESLTELEAEDRLTAELVKLRLFSGLSVTDAGEALQVSRAESYRLWKFARVWFATRGVANMKDP